MCKKLIYLFSFVLVLGLAASSAGVVLPVDEWKSIELSRRATDSKEEVS